MHHRSYSRLIRFLIGIAGLLSLQSLGGCTSSESGGDAGDLVISEIMYNEGKNDSLEWIEIHNTGQVSFDLAGIVLTGGVDYTFPDTISSLKPGGYLVITGNLSDFSSRFPAVEVLGPFVGRLANNGENLKMSQKGEVLFECQYDNDYPWPVMADGGGFSLALVGKSPQEASSWQASSTEGGTPGSENSVITDLQVVISEVLPTGNASGGWVELYNQSSEAVDIGNWILSEKMDDADPLVIPAGTVLQSGEYRVLYEVPQGDQLGWSGNFYPSQSGDKLFLIARNAYNSSTGYGFKFDYPTLDAGNSAGLQCLDNTSCYVTPLATATPGAANTTSEVGPVIINEIHYHPLDSEAEFVELKNLTTDTIELANSLDLTKRWDLSGIGIIFPAGAMMMPNGLCVLVREDDMDTLSFRTQYAVPSSVPIFGYSAKLDNGGETLTLKRPASQISKNDGSLSWSMAWSDQVQYSDDDPWPAEADGQGSSLNRIGSLFGNDPSSWTAGSPTPGQ